MHAGDADKMNMELAEFMTIKAMFVEDLREIMRNYPEDGRNEVLAMLVENTVTDLEMLAKLTPAGAPLPQFDDVDPAEFTRNLMERVESGGGAERGSGSGSSGSDEAAGWR